MAPRRGREGLDEEGTGIARRRHAVSAFVLVLVLATSCVGDDGSAASGGGSPASDPRLGGTVLVSRGFGGELATVELPGGEPQPLRMPEGLAFVQEGYFLDDGSVVAVIQEGSAVTRVYRVSRDEPPVAVGGPLQGAFSFSFAGGRLLAARCDDRRGAYVLDVASASGWEEVDGACGATLSPDGASIVWSPDGTAVLRGAASPGASSETILDVGEIPGMPPGMRSGAQIIGRPAWGPTGLAIPLGTNERQAAAVIGADGTVAVTRLGNRGAGIGASLEWQPSGELLAAGSWSNLEALVWVLSPRGDSRIVAMDADPIAGLVWSPSGEALLAASQARWTFVTPQGQWLRSMPVPRGDLLPRAWRSG